MTEQRGTACVPPARLTIAAVVLRAVPCSQHDAYERLCPECLTGEQAAARGVQQQTERLGVISDSNWKRWSPRRWLAIWRIKQANRCLERTQ